MHDIKMKNLPIHRRVPSVKVDVRQIVGRESARTSCVQLVMGLYMGGHGLLKTVVLPVIERGSTIEGKNVGVVKGGRLIVRIPDTKLVRTYGAGRGRVLRAYNRGTP